MRPEVITGTIITAVLCVGLCSCSDDGPTDDTPEGALTLFMKSADPMQREFDRERSYKLLAPETQDLLISRAKTASKQGKRSFDPHDMIVAERFVTRWEIKRMESAVDGERAKVTAYGDDESSQKATVDLKQIDGHWRVVLPLDML